MQTFLPYEDFENSLQALDTKRLGKQRVEAKQILNIVSGISPFSRWRNHPAVNMWRGYSQALRHYYNIALNVWIAKGYKNTMVHAIYDDTPIIFPDWLGDKRLHSSHRSNLLRKKPDFYSKYGWSEADDMPYFWPTKEGYVVKEE